MGECERAGAEWKGGAEHEACDLVSDKDIMIESLGSMCGENLPGGELIMWKIGGTGRREVFAVKGCEQVMMMMMVK